MLWYFPFAERFGWTKDQVDQQPFLFLHSMAVIGSVADEVRNDQASR